MRKLVVVIVFVAVAFLSFLAGGRYSKGKSGGTGSQVESISAGAILEQDDSAVSLAPGAVKINPDRQQLIGVKVAAVEKKPMTYTLRLYGRVVPDETKVYRVNASTDCWIRELSDVTTGSIVNKDKVLAEALAPAYYNAQLTYVLSLDNIDRIRKQLGGEVRHQQGDMADNQIRMAVQSMQNLGITDAQIEELAKTRKARPYLQVRAPVKGVVLSRSITLNQWFKAGDEFYRIADIGKIWVYADVYEDEAMHMKPGMSVEVKHAQTGKTFSASVGEVLPLFDPVARTLKVRVDIDNPIYDLRPDMFVDVEIPITMPPSLNVPADAVLDSGTKTIVYVDAGNGNFEPRRVKTGWRLGRQVEITGGLMPGEKVVVSGNFLIDSESRMEIAGLGTGANISEDPVCGRNVDKDEAESFERIATYGNETFYFCSEPCKKQFEREPEKYLSKEGPDRKKRDRAVISGEEGGRSWADLLNRATGSPGMEDESREIHEGPYPFPGARYLGTVPREPAPAEGEPPVDRIPPRQFEIPAAPPVGTQLK
ncbi:MAG: efflux RND transporter periplasmic adaptor subunit [Deltaproteobacteria bacterium]|nr:efflux RND transporter periplasmic adaptor subunit [Deltaproteobacteria bacterium]